MPFVSKHKSGKVSLPSPASIGEKNLAAAEASDPAFDEESRQYVLDTDDKAWREYERHACSVDLLGGGSAFKRFWRRWVKIRPEGGGLIRPQMGPIQVAVNDEIDRQIELGIPVRIRILKPRKAWVSTLIEARMYHYITMVKTHSDGICVAQDFETATYLVRIAKTIHQNCPPWLVPEATANGRYHFGFDSRDAIIEMKTAATYKTMHGRSPVFLHDSEVARWARTAELTAEAVYNALPMIPGTFGLDETVANGRGGYFFEQWEAVEKMKAEGKSTHFTNLFFSWLKHTPYRAELYPIELAHGVFEKSLDDEEKLLRDHYGASLEQLKWRRMAIESKCMGSVERFHEQYPTTADEAFLGSGRPYFAEKCIKHLNVWNATVDEPKPPIEIPLECDIARIVNGRDMRVHISAMLTVWKEPEPGREYVAFGDPAEGVDPSLTNRDPDWNVADFGDKRTWDQVAELRGKWDTDIFAELLLQAGYYYNTACVGWERHGIGEVLTSILQQSGYPDLFSRVDRETGKVELGWETTSHTRSPLLAKAKASIRDGVGRIRSKGCIAEHFAMATDAKGRVGPLKGHDDRVFARAGRIMITDELALRDEEKPVQGNPYDPTELRRRERENQVREAEEAAAMAREEQDAEWGSIEDFSEVFA